MKESDHQTKVVNWLREQGYYAVVIHADEMQERGIADILSCIDGLFVAIEMKTPDEEPSTIQKYHIAKVIEAGGKAFIGSTLEDVKEQLTILGLYG